jgi:hypothetical protein
MFWLNKNLNYFLHKIELLTYFVGALSSWMDKFLSGQKNFIVSTFLFEYSKTISFLFFVLTIIDLEK